MQMKSPGLSIRHAKQRGEWAELRFSTRAIELGFRVSKPWGDSAPYDLVIDYRGRFRRVQVKCTIFHRGNSYKCHLDSNEDDIVLDPFCGCGTAISAAQKLKRRWIGIDITHLSIGLIKTRLTDAFGDSVRATYEVIGEPVDLPGAEKLAEEDKYQFQWWALSLAGARPQEKKKGADQGIDGRLYFHDEAKGGTTKQIIFSVKGGHLAATHVRDLRGVIERERAEIGVLISMEPPTKPMLREAAEAGLYQVPGMRDKYPRLQILSIAELLNGKRVEFPRFASDATFKRAPKARKAAEEQIPLGGGDIEEPF